MEKQIEQWKRSVRQSNLQDDPEDARDYLFNPAKLPQAPLPASKDLRPLTPQVEDQGNIGSCVAQACVNMYEILLTKSDNFYDLSRLFLYYTVREERPELCCIDAGAYLRDGVREAYKKGVCKESIYPYITSKVNEKPTPEAYQNALSTKVGRYERVHGLDSGYYANPLAIQDMKMALAKGFPVAISMKLANEFFSLSGPLSTHDYKGIDEEHPSIGGHAMCIVGFDDAMNGFIVENSWGPSFGDGGFWLLDYDIVMTNVRDGWVVTNFNGIDYEDEWAPDAQLTNNTALNFPFYIEDFEGFGPMTSTVQGGTGDLEYSWRMDAYGLDTALTHASEKTAYFRLPGHTKNPTTYTGYVYVSDTTGLSCKQLFTLNMFDGHNPNYESPSADFVRRLYTVMLERPADESGVSYWAEALDNQIITGAGIVKAFTEQPEYDEKMYTECEEVSKIYQTMLKRDPDCPGYAYWLSYYVENQSLDSMIDGLSHSDEFISICREAGIRPY